MTHCTVRHALLLASILATSAATVASACGPTRWQANTTGLPACVGIQGAGNNDWEVRNDCDDNLTLATPSECPGCSVPSVVAAGDMALIGLFEPGEEEPTVDVEWELGEEAGTVSFSRPITRCPQGRSCAAAAYDSGSVPWGLALFCMAALFSRGTKRSSRAHAHSR